MAAKYFHIIHELIFDFKPEVIEIIVYRQGNIS